ncbi:MAG: hemolysin family protein [Candidatus Caldatribacteriota bacterium]|nr:hemolysin family protein [Atribacterota bacterium]MDD4289140.1 hemolysin family protein [Atribacterota bacterium]
MEDGSPWIAIGIVVFLIIINGILASSEISLISLKKVKLRNKIESGDKKAKLLLEMKQNPSDFLSTIQIGITLAGLLSGAFAADTLAKPLIKWLSTFAIPQTWLSFIDIFMVFLITIILTYFMLVFGELVPKRLAMRNPYKISSRFVSPIIFLSVVTKPLVRLLSISTNSVLRFLGIEPTQDEHIMTEEEILLNLREGREQGTIEETEEHIVKNLFKFTDSLVEDAMVHRTEIQAVPVESSFIDIVKMMKKTSHGKFPVFEESIDKIVGVVYSKDFISMYPSEEVKTPILKVKDIMRPPFFVPESHLLVNLFSEMKQHKDYLAVVVDEYGGTSGIITMTDILEEIVGDIEKPYIEMIQKITGGGFLVDGRIKMKDLLEFLNISIDTDENNTLSGFIIDSLGYVPEKEESPEVEVESYIFRVKEMSGPLIHSVYIKNK